MKPDWLSQLAADRAPPPLGWWPPAPGWWGVAVALLLIALAGGLWYRRRRKGTPRLRRAAEQAMQGLHDASMDDATLARQLQDLMRRFALARFGHAEVARLSGEAWLNFVIQHGGQDWAGETGRLLLRCAYGDQSVRVSSTERSRWLAGAHAFLKGAK